MGKILRRGAQFTIVAGSLAVLVAFVPSILWRIFVAIGKEGHEHAGEFLVYLAIVIGICMIPPVLLARRLEQDEDS